MAQVDLCNILCQLLQYPPTGPDRPLGRANPVLARWRDTALGPAGTTPLPTTSQGRPCPVWMHIMSWILLLVAGLFEVAWAIGLKYTEGFSRPLPTLLTLGAMGVSVLLLAMAVKQLPLGTAYAVWTGIGAVGTVLMGIWLFNEPATLARVLCLLLIISGILGLKLIG